MAKLLVKINGPVGAYVSRADGGWLRDVDTSSAFAVNYQDAKNHEQVWITPQKGRRIKSGTTVDVLTTEFETITISANLRTTWSTTYGTDAWGFDVTSDMVNGTIMNMDYDPPFQMTFTDEDATKAPEPEKPSTYSFDAKVNGKVTVSVENQDGTVTATAGGGEVFSGHWTSDDDCSTIWVRPNDTVKAIANATTLHYYDKTDGTEKYSTLNLRRTKDGKEEWGVKSFYTMHFPEQFDGGASSGSTPVVWEVGTVAKDPDPVPDPDPEPNPGEGGSNSAKTTNNVFLMDDAALKAFRKKDYDIVRFTSLQDGTKQGFQYNYNKFVMSLMQFGFKLPDSAIAVDKGYVTLGTYDTQVIAPLLNTDTLTLSLGHIKIPEPESSIDLSNTSYQLYLPFIASPITIENAYVGKNIRMSYVVDLYNGDVTVNIFVEGSQIPFYTTKEVIGRRIPLVSNGNDNYEMGSMGGVYNNVYRPYILISKPEIANVEDGAMVEVKGSLNQFTGLVKARLFEINAPIKQNERDMIKSLLGEGVWVK